MNKRQKKKKDKFNKLCSECIGNATSWSHIRWEKEYRRRQSNARI